MQLKRLRTILRVYGLTFGMLLKPCIYSPLGTVAAFERVVRSALLPLGVVTGIARWQQATARWPLATGEST